MDDRALRYTMPSGGIKPCRRIFRTRRRVGGGVLVVWALLLAVVASAVAAGAEPGQGVRLELMSLQVPVEGRGGSRRHQATVVAYIDLADDASLERVCHMAPRLLDAFLDVMYDRAIRIQPDRSIDDSDVAPLLLAAARRALGLADVERVMLGNGHADAMFNPRKLNASCNDLPVVKVSARR